MLICQNPGSTDDQLWISKRSGHVRSQHWNLSFRKLLLPASKTCAQVICFFNSGQLTKFACAQVNLPMSKICVQVFGIRFQWKPSYFPYALRAFQKVGAENPLSLNAPPYSYATAYMRLSETFENFQLSSIKEQGSWCPMERYQRFTESDEKKSSFKAHLLNSCGRKVNDVGKKWSVHNFQWQSIMTWLG